MPRSLLIKRIIIGAAIAIILVPIGAFVYTRFLMTQYHFDQSYDTIAYQGQIYVRRDTWSENDMDNLGKLVGIAVPDNRGVGDYIWPFWVLEYTDDREHTKLFVRGLMDTGSVYAKNR